MNDFGHSLQFVILLSTIIEIILLAFFLIVHYPPPYLGNRKVLFGIISLVDPEISSRI